MCSQRALSPSASKGKATPRSPGTPPGKETLAAEAALGSTDAPGGKAFSFSNEHRTTSWGKAATNSSGRGPRLWSSHPLGTSYATAKQSPLTRDKGVSPLLPRHRTLSTSSVEQTPGSTSNSGGFQGVGAQTNSLASFMPPKPDHLTGAMASSPGSRSSDSTSSKACATSAIHRDWRAERSAKKLQRSARLLSSLPPLPCQLVTASLWTARLWSSPRGR